MRRTTGDRQLRPGDPLHSFDDPDRHAFVLEDRPLLDVQLDVGVRRRRRGARERTGVADADELVAEAGAVVGRRDIERLLEGHAPDVDEAAEHVRGETGALLVGEEGDADRPASRDAERLQRLDDFEPGEHTEVAVEPAARGDCVDVRSGHHRRRAGIGAGASADDVADGVDGDGEAEIAHPAGDEVAALAIGLGEGKSGTAELAARTGDRADLAEGDDAAPQPFAVDADVGPGHVARRGGVGSLVHQRQVWPPTYT